MEIQQLRVPATLRKYTQMQNPALKSINSERTEKLELAAQTNNAQKSALEQQIEQTRQQVQILQRENQTMLTTLKNLQFQRIPNHTKMLNDEKAMIDRYKSQRKKLQQNLRELLQQKQLLEAEVSRPYSNYDEYQRRMYDLQNKIDETTIKQQETIGISDCFKTVIIKLKQEQLRFEKELEFQRIEMSMLNKDEQDIMNYVSESFETYDAVQQDYKLFKEQLDSQLEQQQTILRQKTEEKDKQLAQPLMYLEENLILDNLSSNQSQQSTRLLIAPLVKQLNIRDLEQFTERARLQVQQLEGLGQQIQQNSVQLKDLVDQISQQKVQINETQFQIQNQMNIKSNRQIQMDLAEKRKIRQQHMIRQQQTARLGNEIKQNIQHMYELVNIIKSQEEVEGELDFEVAAKDVDCAIRTIIAKNDTLAKIITQQLEVPPTGNLQLTTAAQDASATLTTTQPVTLDFDDFDDFQVSEAPSHVNFNQPVQAAPTLSRKDSSQLFATASEERRRMKRQSQAVIQQNSKKENWL